MSHKSFLYCFLEVLGNSLAFLNVYWTFLVVFMLLFISFASMVLLSTWKCLHGLSLRFL